METLNNLIQTVGLNQSFFYHILIGLIVYPISKKGLWIPYIESLDEKNKLTKGRLSNTKELDLQIQDCRELYEKKAKKIHKDFQAVFNEIKELALREFSKESLEMEKESKKRLSKKIIDLKAMVKDQEEPLKKELPSLSMLLVDKIKG